MEEMSMAAEPSYRSLDVDIAVDRFAALDAAEQLVVWGCRRWVAAVRGEHCPVAVLTPSFERFGVGEAALSLDALLRVTARTALGRFEVRCCRCPQVSADELRLVAAAAAAQQGDAGLTRARLAGWLDRQGVSFALAPTRGLAILLASAGLVLPLRSGVDAVPTTAARDVAAQPCTLH
jgi:hypothetical protein